MGLRDNRSPMQALRLYAGPKARQHIEQHGLRPQEHFEQIQWWQFKGLFSKRPDQAKQHRSEGVGNAVLAYYRSHPFYLFRRLWSILRYGPSNRYLTCVFTR